MAASVSAPGSAPSSQDSPQDKPWWRHPMVWLVIGGPAVVVVAGLVTAYIAISGADEVIVTKPDSFSERPAMQGRNHAATPQQSTR